MCRGSFNDDTSTASCTTNGDEAATTGGFAAPLEAFLNPREEEHQDTEKGPASLAEDSGSRDTSAVQEDQTEELTDNSSGRQERSGSTSLAVGATGNQGPTGELQNAGGDGDNGVGGAQEDEDEENRGGMHRRVFAVLLELDRPRRVSPPHPSRRASHTA